MVAPSEVAWNASTLGLGSTYVGGSSPTGSESIFSNGSNTNVTVDCASGNCSVIFDTWNDATGMTNESSPAGFICNGSSVGSYSAVFDVTSVEDTSPDQITVSCEITEISVEWEATSLSLYGDRDAGPATDSVNITSTGPNTNVTVVCDSGNCSSIISDDWTDGTDMSAGQEAEVIFTCDDSTEGSYSAVFNVTSVEDTIPSQIRVSCNIVIQKSVTWDAPTLNISGYVGAGVTGSDGILSIGDNDFVSVSCVGNCTGITDDWVDGTNMTDRESSPVRFTCDDSVEGTYSAIFEVIYSAEVSSWDEVNVTCTVTTAPEDDDDDSGAEDYECFTSSDCGECEKCNSHECVEDERKCPPPECESDSDCGSNEECDDGECVEVEVKEEVPLVPELKAPPEEEESPPALEEESSGGEVNASLLEVKEPEQPPLSPPPEEEQPPPPDQREIAGGSEPEEPQQEDGILGPLAALLLLAALAAIFLFARGRKKKA